MANQKCPYHDGAAHGSDLEGGETNETMCGANLTIVLRKAAENYTGSALPPVSFSSHTAAANWPFLRPPYPSKDRSRARNQVTKPVLQLMPSLQG